MEVCFGLPGVHNLALWEALRASPIRLVGVRHEQTAAYAADGYARATGRLGVALTTTGPGAANTLGAVGEAWASRSPILVDRDRHPVRAAPPGCLPRRPARDRRPGGDVRAGDEVDARRRPRRASAAAAARRCAALDRADAARSTSRSRPTCSPPSCRPSARRASARRPPRTTAPLDAAAARRSTRAERPLLWVGGGARDAAAEVARAGRAARRAGADDLRRGRRPAARPPVPGRAAAARRRRGALWDEADVVLAIGSDLDGVQTQNFAQPQPPTLIAINARARADRTTASTTLLGDAAAVTRGARRAARAAARPRRARRAAARGPRARPAARSTRRALRFLDAIRFALPDDGVARRRHVHPGLLARRLPHAAPRRGGCRSRSAGARSATRSRPRSAPRSPAPARSSRSPATAASCTRAASSPRSPRSRSR